MSSTRTRLPATADPSTTKSTSGMVVSARVIEGVAAPILACSPDVVLEASTLAALYFGSAKATTLAGIGLVEERTPGSAALLNRLFATESAPWCSLMF